jgi:hypothetical protein
MEKKEFHVFRTRFQKTQKEMSELLGTSVKAVQSFEQGWRKVPVHVERQLLFLWSMKRNGKKGLRSCWEVRRCSLHIREHCPAYEFHSGRLCWFINGTLCHGKTQGSWEKKMRICRICDFFALAVGETRGLKAEGNGNGCNSSPGRTTAKPSRRSR